MSDRNPMIPSDLSEEYDEHVDDALDLANGRLSPERAAAVRARMAADPAYRGVVQSLLDAHDQPEVMSEDDLRHQWQAFTRRAGLSTVEADLAEFQKRVKSREREGRHRIYLVAAIVVVLVGIPIVGLTYMFGNYFERVETASNVTSRIELPDGSVATLAPSSKLEYRTGMVTPQGNLNREVTLHGSADFVVTNKAERQFVVLTSHAHVMVVGTQFRVEVQKSFTLVTVREGVVRTQAVDDEGKRVGTAHMVQAGGTVRIFSDGTVATEGQVIPPIRRTTP
jgi:ferric-dicitrate binding protein FerR (iron transport regulator)